MDKDKYKSNSLMNDITQTKNVSRNNFDFHPEICVERNDNAEDDKTSGYDSVIKHFDDLISELSCERIVNDRTTNLSKNRAFENQDVTLYRQNSKNQCGGSYTEICDKGPSRNKKSISGYQLSEMTTVLSSEDKTHPIDNAIHITKPEQFGITNVTSSKKFLKQKSFLNMKENWTNSHLWDCEKEIISLQSEKPFLETSKNMPANEFKKNFAGNYCNLPQFMLKNMPQVANTYDKTYLLQQQQQNLSCYKTNTKYESKVFSQAGNSLQAKHHPNLGFVKNRSSDSLSIPRSSKTFQSQASKYTLPNNCFLVKLFIETKDLHLGPFMIEIFSKMTLRLLKLKVEQEHGILSSLQRWILGKNFAVDNEKSLADYNVLPGSSIIVYLDTDKKVLNDASKIKVSNEKSTMKYKNAQIVNKKQKSGSYDNLNNIDKELVSLVRKDSLDSKLAESYSKTDAVSYSDCSNQSSECENVNSVLDKQKCKQFTQKAKNVSKNIRFKKKTQIVIHDKQNLSDFNNSKNYVLNMQNDDNLEKLDSDFPNQACNNSKNYLFNMQSVDTLEKPDSDFPNQVYDTEKQLSNSIQFKPLFEEITSKSSQFSLLKQPQNISFMNDVIDGVHFEQSSSKTDKINYQNKVPVLSTESKDYEEFNAKFSYKEKVFQEIYENEKKVDINSENKIENENQNMSLVESSDKFLDEYACLNVPNVQKEMNIHSSIISPDEETKRKQSITSLIRKLSLTRKAKSVDDDCSHTEISNQVMIKNEIKDENNSQFSSKNINQPIPNDIYLEVSSLEQNNFSFENEQIVEKNEKSLQPDADNHNAESVKNFELLLESENMDLVSNTFNFTCTVCFDEFECGQGVILHECLHTFCRDCLVNAIFYADGALVKCPYRDDFYTCQSHLQQREVKALVSEEMYEKYLQRSITTAEGLAEKSFHCKTPDCKGWCIYDNAINVFHCPVCSHYNCLNCHAIHEGLNCRQYQDKLKLQQKMDKESEKTLALLNEMIKSGKALHCPKCDLILLKKWGCDWLKCSVCKTEICWITKGPRWGPGGQGDTSGGCKCGVNGVKCHPSCTYCH